MSGPMRSPTRLLLVAATIVSLTALALALAPSAVASSASESSPRGGDLHVTKECSQFTGLADTFCTITYSSLSAINAGSRVVYLQAAGTDWSLDSDVILVVGPGNFALGHCTVSPLNVGLCTFSGVIGQFTGFHARVSVSSIDPLGIVVHWDGKYSFSLDD